MLPSPPFTGNRFLRSPVITDPDFKESTVQQYDLDLQYQHKSYVFSVAYAGAKGTHLALGRSNNQPPLASSSNPVNGLTTNSVANADERVPFVGLSPVVARLVSGGDSIYSSLQATLKKDLSHGFQFLGAYTFSKSIDDAGDSLGGTIGGTFGQPIFGEMVYNNQNDIAVQRGVSDFDRTQRLVISGIWNVPGPEHAKKRSCSETRRWLEHPCVSPLCNPDSLSASWTAQPVRCLGRQPCIPQEAWLLERHLLMPVGGEASAAA